MGSVIVAQSISLDGFSAGVNDGPANGLGDNGGTLHEWFIANATPESAIVMEAFWSRVGAVILGRRMFDNGIGYWGKTNPWPLPAFVLTHELFDFPVPAGDSPFTFVTDGIDSALALAREAAGEKAVAIAGGANTIQQYLRAGLIDELNLHLVPVLLGDGVRFFDRAGAAPIRFEAAGLSETPGATHIRYGIPKN